MVVHPENTGLQPQLTVFTIHFILSHDSSGTQRVHRQPYCVKGPSPGSSPGSRFCAELARQKSCKNRSPTRKQLLTTERRQIQSILKSVELPFFCSTTFPLQIRAGPGHQFCLIPGKCFQLRFIGMKRLGIY